jgi:hypothetical protein
MISEKTVELNTTAELLPWLQYVTGFVHTAIGPSQREEAVWGYDVSFHGGSTAAALIQYKRAYVSGTVWTWKLNRTTRQDQHARLQFLQSLGYPVFYAFPHFAMPAQVVALRHRLLLATWWYPPSYINPAGGPSGHHDVTYDTSNGRWQVSSPEPTDLRPPLTIGDVVEAMEDQIRRRTSIEEFVANLNRVMLAADQKFSTAASESDAESDFTGQSLLLRHWR